MSAAVALVRRAYEAWNAGDWATMGELFDPNGEMRPVLGAAENTVFYGVEGVKAYRQAAEDLLGKLTATPIEILSADDEHVLVLSHVSGRGAASGIEVDQHFVYLWKVRDGRIALMQSFANETDALAALGAEDVAAEAQPATPSRPSPGGARRPSGEAARARPGA